MNARTRVSTSISAFRLPSKQTFLVLKFSPREISSLLAFRQAERTNDDFANELGINSTMLEKIKMKKAIATRRVIEALGLTYVGKEGRNVKFALAR